MPPELRIAAGLTRVRLDEPSNRSQPPESRLASGDEESHLNAREYSDAVSHRWGRVCPTVLGGEMT